MRDIRAVFLTLFTLLAIDASAVTIPTVLVGDVGNPNDPATGNLYGGVSHEYRIGTTEVTNAQYTDFLNAKAKSDSLELYNPLMGTFASGGITRSGVSGSFTYAVKPNRGDKPVVLVTWFDALRFANWLHNGQGNGDTETGAYTLLGGTAVPSNGDTITRNADANWFLPSENEWYKAAYYQPAAQGGDVDSYWLYPTATNSEPTDATANSVGDISNPGPNVMTVENGTLSALYQGGVTTVGSAGPLSESFYGTSDQAGNAWEFTDTFQGGAIVRGSNWTYDHRAAQSSYRLAMFLWYNGDQLGFRVATIPEPSTVALAAVGLLALIGIAKRRARKLRHSMMSVGIAVDQIEQKFDRTTPAGRE